MDLFINLKKMNLMNEEILNMAKSEIAILKTTISEGKHIKS